MSQFYTSVTAVAHEVKDISHRLPSDKISELTAMVPPEVTAPPHLEPDVAHMLGYSAEVVLEMVQRGADILSVVTGFPILCRYISEGNYEAVCRIIEVSGYSCNVLFLCDKNLRLPLSYVKKKKGRNLYIYVGRYALAVVLFTHTIFPVYASRHAQGAVPYFIW